MRLNAFSTCVVALLLGVSAAHTTQAVQGGVISGRVIDTAGQIPIVGAVVTIWPAPVGRPTGPPAPGLVGPPPQAVTGDDGAYVFSGVAVGRYRVQAQKTGFISPSAANPPIVQVGGGQQAVAVDIPLTRGAVISGRVLDVRGDPLPQVRVAAVRKAPPAAVRGGVNPAVPAGQAGQAGQTNDVGEFRITGLPAGDYFVAASPRPASPFATAPTTSAATPVTTFYPGTAEISGARLVTVAGGQTVAELEFGMLYARGFTVSGIVVNEMHQPVGGAVVMLMPAQPSMVTLGLQASSRVQPDGTFTIGSVVPGTYRVGASIPVVTSRGGTVSMGIAGGPVMVAGASTWIAAPTTTVSVTVGSADVPGVTIVVSKPPARQ